MSNRDNPSPARGGQRRSARRVLWGVVGLLASWTWPADARATTPAPTATPKACQVCGDANGSGTVDIVDALVISQTTVGLRSDPPCVLQSDVNADGQVSIVDALFISQLAVNLRTTLTCPGCGNGRLDPGEQCDPPGADCASGEACSTDCGCVVCHDLCTAGAPLAAGCDACVASVCAVDPACCSAAWDSKCVGDANLLCNAACAVCGNGVVQPGEQCDPPGAPCGGGGTCGATCACEACSANVCGNADCEVGRGETECNCPADCTAAVCTTCEAEVASCGDGFCDPCVQGGESPETCPADCPPCG